MAMGTGLRVALGVAAGAGLGGIGVLVLPALLVPSAPVQGDRADQELAAAVEATPPAIVAEVAPPAAAAPAAEVAPAAPGPATAEVSPAATEAVAAGTDPAEAPTPEAAEVAALDPAAAPPADAAAPAGAEPSPPAEASPATPASDSPTEGAEAAALEAGPEAATAADAAAQADPPPQALASAEATEPTDPAAPGEDAATAPDPLAPRFDTVRIYADGTGLVAGRAEPGSRVEILADGEPVAEATADADGAFVAFLSLPPSPDPRAVALRDAEGRASEETVLLAPAPPPAQVEVAALDPSALPASPLDDPAAVPSDVSSNDGTPDEVAALEPSDPPTDAASAAAEGALEPAAPDLAEAPATAAAPPADAGAPAVATAEATDPATPSAAAPDAPPDAAPVPEVAAEAPDLAPPPASPGQAPVLLSDSNGVRVLQPALAPGAAPDLLATVALDAVTYDGTGEVVVSGRAQGGTVRLYLDNTPVAEVAPDADGRWSTTLTDAPPGVYTLRLDQVDAAGEVTSRIETPFQREERAALATLLEEERTGQPVVLRVVQPGNSLWAIARDRYDEPLMYVRVFEANRDRIRDPDLIYPGQVFVLPPASTP